MVTIEGYSEKYKKGVISYLRRAVSILEGKSDADILKWFSPCISYSWKEDISIEEFPYKYGIVLFDDEIVVGYLGLIYSYCYVSGKRVVFVNPTTWSIDKKYGFHIFTAMNIMIESADIIGEFSPSEFVKNMCIKMYKFECLDEKMYKFYPRIALVNNFKKKEIKDSLAIEDSIIRNKYIDNKMFGVKCIELSNDDNKFWVFYKEYPAKVKKLIPVTKAKILDTSNTDLFTANMKEIIWFIQKQGNYFVDVESRFFGNVLSYNCRHRLYDISRLVYSKIPDVARLGMLYSEVVMLD